MGLLMLDLLVAYQLVQAQSCTRDPLGGEICLPGPSPSPSPKPTPEKPDKPKQTVIVPPCFGPCTHFPPAPPYRQFQELVEKTDAADMVITVDGLRYGEIVDPHSLLFTNELNEPGVNAWVRGFGGASSNGAELAIATPTSAMAAASSASTFRSAMKPASASSAPMR